MATILAHIRIREGFEQRFEALARTLYSATHREESGVRRYEYWRGQEPRLYYSLLSFDDFQTFLAHQTSEHHEVAAPLLGQVIESLRLEWVDPIVDASDLPATEPQEAPRHADDLTKLYAERFAAHLAPWWSALREAN